MCHLLRGAFSDHPCKWSPLEPWPGSSVCWSMVSIYQGCGRDPHIWESTNECVNGWKNKSMFLSLSLSLSLSTTTNLIKSKIKEGPWVLSSKLPCLIFFMPQFQPYTFISHKMGNVGRGLVCVCCCLPFTYSGSHSINTWWTNGWVRVTK